MHRSILALFGPKINPKTIQKVISATYTCILALSGGQNEVKMELLEHPKYHFRNIYMHSGTFRGQNGIQNDQNFNFCNIYMHSGAFRMPKWSQNGGFGAPGFHFSQHIHAFRCFLEVKMELKIIQISILEVNTCIPVLFGAQSGVWAPFINYLLKLKIYLTQSPAGAIALERP
jgi:hypothetical protein